MADHTENHRESIADEAYLIRDEREHAAAEARNVIRQFDVAMDLIREHLSSGKPFRLRVSHILDLHRVGLEGIHAYAGNFRPAGVTITNSRHEPVGPSLVPSFVDDLCDYVNENWHRKTALHLAAYVMWRLNWIHPFADGNGRTSRILSYLILSLRTGELFPGRNTIPEQIEKDRSQYFEALEAADAAAKAGETDVSRMESLLDYMLAEQLMSALERARQRDHEV